MNSRTKNESFIIENQDFLSMMQLQKVFVWCTNINGIEDINLPLDDYVKGNDEILRNLSTDNLLIFRVNANLEIQKKIDSIISERIKHGKHLCEGSKKEWTVFVNTEVHNNIFGKLNNEFNFVDCLNKKMRELKLTNPAIFNYLKQAKSYITIDNFLDFYEKRIVTNDKLDFLQGLVGENPNVIDSINYGICQEDIFSMNPEFLKRIAKYMNQSAQLISIHNNTPTVFEALKKQIDIWEQTLTPREITNLENLVLQNCAMYGHELRNFKENDIEQLLNFCARKKMDMNANLPYSENYMQECDEFYTEQFNSNLEKYRKTTQKTIKNGYWMNMIDNYCKRILGMPFNVCKDFYSKKLENLDVETVENSELKQYIEELKSIITLARNTDESVQYLEEKMNNGTTIKFHPIFSYKANDLVNIELVNTFKESFDNTAEKFANSDEYEVVEYNGEKIKQINVSGNFSLIIRSTDTGYIEDKKLIDGSVKKTEEQKSDPAMELKAGCFITENYLGVAPLGENGVYMAYLNNNSDTVGEIGIYDINSNGKDYGVTSENGKGMPYYKTIQNCRGPYAEASIINRPPDAIGIFSDATPEQKELAYKTALEYGVDILYFDKEKIVEKQIENLEMLLSNFSNTGDIEILKELISMYETNVAGWLLNRAPGEDESCTKSINNDRFLPLFQEIEDKIYDALGKYCISQKENSNGLENIFAIRDIMTEELNKYENLLQVKELSKVKMKFRAEDIIQILDNQYKLLNGTTVKESENAQSEYTKIETVDLHLLVARFVEKENLGMNDVEEVRRIVDPQIEKEGISK